MQQDVMTLVALLSNLWAYSTFRAEWIFEFTRKRPHQHVLSLAFRFKDEGQDGMPLNRTSDG